jgi:CDP-diacylglycerol--serine O-phosphatidyltransferase
LDGEVARRLAVTSEFGRYLDSLSDTVIFGAAPAVVVRSHLQTTALDVAWIWPFGLAYVAAGVYRLARFTLASDGGKPRDTLGLTISTSGALVTLSVLTDRVYGGRLFPDFFFAVILGLAALLMGSRVHFPELRVVLFNRWLNLALLGAAVAVSLFFSVQLVGLALAAGYISFGLIRAGLRFL